MKMKYKISLIIVGILLVMSTTVCSSYSYWTLTEEQEEANVVETGCLNLTLDEGSSTSINLENAFPVDTKTGKTLEPYTLTITNDCTIDAKYTLLLVTDSSNTLDDEFVDIYLNKTNHDVIDTTLNLLTTTTDYDVAMEDELDDQGIDEATAYELTSGVLAPYGEITYNLRLWVNESATNDQMLSDFLAAVEVYYEATSHIEDELSATTNYSGYYADTDNDGTPDGVIFVDLLKTSNNNQTTVSGTWNSDSDSTYSYNTVESSKSYSISSNNYDGVFGKYPIISIKNNSEGNDRFYVMALEDIDSNTYSWNYNYSTNGYTMDSAYMEPESTTQVSMQDSSGQSIGKRNTAILMQADELKDYSNNLWNYISTQVTNGWFVPSRAEWAAFGDYAVTKVGVTTGNYDTYGLRYAYWSSSMENTSITWYDYFSTGYIYDNYANLSICARLATIF